MGNINDQANSKMAWSFIFGNFWKSAKNLEKMGRKVYFKTKEGEKNKEKKIKKR